MIDMRQIRRLAHQIAERFHPLQIILFGSYAYGTPTEDSDVDVLVVMPCGAATWDKEFAVRQAVHAPFPWDVLVRSPTELAARAAMDDYFVQEIMSKGKLLYEATDAAVGQEGRRRLPKCPARTGRKKAPESRRRLLSRATVH